MSPHEIDVLEANSAFYVAFLRRDVEAMDAVWARRAPVACIHPGYGVLRGRAAVIDSWRGILGSDASPKITCSDAAAHVLGEAAFVTCRELIGGGRLIATNIFVHEDGKWRMVHHQAAPVAAPEGEGNPGPVTLN